MQSIGIAMALLAAAPAGAGQDQAPVKLPVTVEEAAAKPEFNEPFNKAASYTRPGETITIYLFRATHPNAALWFDRAETVIQVNWTSRGLGAGGETRRLAVGGAATPNALVRVFPLSGGSRSTGVGVAQLGQWMLKVRSTSQTLDVEQQYARLERILAQFTTGASGPVHPLVLPEPCGARGAASDITALLGSEAVDRPSGETILSAGASLLGAADRMSGGKDGLASAPELYCREVMAGQEQVGVLYRRKNAAQKEWTALFSDSGTSVSGLPVTLLSGGKAKEGGMLTANTFDKTRVVMFAQDVPAPEASFPVAARLILSGNKQGYTAVAYGTNTIEVDLPK